MDGFSYETFTGRNLGFVFAADQERLRRAHVFVAVSAAIIPSESHAARLASLSMAAPSETKPYRW